jgi:group I intron endonuclease
MTGIYKITSPTKKVYIGQSKDIIKRFKSYNQKLGKGQPRLNNSFLKYGIKNHVF